MNQKFIIQEKVRFQHCDFAGIVFYPRYYEMINATIEDFFDSVGFGFDKMHEEGYGVPMKNLTTSFQQASRLNDVLSKQLSIKKIGNSSVVFDIVFYHNNNIVLQSEAVLVFVTIDKQNKSITPTPWLEKIKQNMQQYLV